MKLSEFKKQISSISELTFLLPNGSSVPKHFHVTEVGIVTKHFIDCGGTVRLEKVVNFQLFNANDFDHRLKPQKLANIISLSENKLGIGDLEIEVEYQSDTISKYGLHFNGKDFQLVPKHTACLASESCGVSEVKNKIKSLQLAVVGENCCAPGGGCC